MDDDYQDPRPTHCERSMLVFADWDHNGHTTRAWYKCEVCKAQVEMSGQGVLEFEKVGEEKLCRVTT